MSTIKEIYGESALNFEVETIDATYDCETFTARVVKDRPRTIMDDAWSALIGYNSGGRYTDYTKYAVKCSENDWYDPEKGLAMAIAKKALGNQGNYYNLFTKWLPEDEEEDLDVEVAFKEFLAELTKLSGNHGGSDGQD